MAGLIDNVLDFARGRLGGGLILERDADQSLEPVLRHIVDEQRTIWPDRSIETDLALASPICCDRRRLGQLFSNLLVNALQHGAAGTPVRVSGHIADGTLDLSVANLGEPIAPATLERLFQPFARESVQPGRRGLGLGLYICAEIARAHDGRLEVASTPRETRFTLRMPVP